MKSDNGYISVFGVAGASSIGLTQIVTASATDQTEQFVGHTYDPVTHEIYRTATARLTRTAVGINGVLNAGELTIPLELRNPNQTPVPQAMVEHPPHDNLLTFKAVHKRPDDPDLSLGLYSSNGITGYFNFSNTEGRTAFKLTKVDRHRSQNVAQNAVSKGIRKKKRVKKAGAGGDQ